MNAIHPSFREPLVLVTGGTGKTGRRVAARLAERGVATRIASRSSEAALDWNDAATWGPALQSVRSVYLAYSPDLAIPGATDTIRAFVDTAKANGVEQIVLLSGRGEDEAQACERIVAASGLRWTVVRASWFAQNFSEGEFLHMVVNNAITLPARDIPEPWVDINDIADVAVAALTESGHDGEVYEVTGPEALTMAEIATLISEASHRPITYVDVPHEDFVTGLKAAGLPGDLIWLLGYLFDTVLDGRNSKAADGVERALGRPARSFRDYAERVAARGAWNTEQPEVA
jgi:uncharacterized protein YbjT (DUF2867 family)